MITTLAPLLMDSAVAEHVSYVAAPIWDIGANFKNQALTFAVYLLMGGTALLAAFYFFVAKNKTMAMRTAAIGIVMIGIVGALPALGVVSKDSVNQMVTGGTR